MIQIITEHLPALTIVIPLLFATLAVALAYLTPQLARWVTIFALAAVTVFAGLNLRHALLEGPIRYSFGNWLPPWGIEYVIDPLAAGITLLISFVSLMVIIYAGSFLKGQTRLRQGVFYALYLLLTGGLLGMVSTGDLFNLYVFLEISSLTCYGLIALGGPRATVASFRYLLQGTIGASFYLLGIGYLYMMTGTLNMLDLQSLLPAIISTPPVIIALVMIALGMGIKMALFPLHGWLPDAYTYAPPQVTAFISSVMTKVSAYVFLRIAFYIIGASGTAVEGLLEIMGWLAAVAIIAGSIMALAQTDLRRMLAYSSVAQIGYIVLGMAIGNFWGLIGALLHILNHAITKGSLFMVAGGIKWKTGEYKIPRYTGMADKMPLSMACFLMGAFSMIGLPPAAGFFSKWYLLLGAVEINNWVFVAVLIVSSLLNLYYFFRVIENAYLKKREETDPINILPQAKSLKPELPLSMLLPIVVFGVAILFLGIFNEQIVSSVLIFSLPKGVQ